MKHPAYQIREKRHRLLMLEERLDMAMKQQLERKRHMLRLKISQLKGLSPLDKLEQGLAFISDTTGASVHSISQVDPGDHICVQLKDGKIHAAVTDKVTEDVKERYEV